MGFSRSRRVSVMFWAMLLLVVGVDCAFGATSPGLLLIHGSWADVVDGKTAYTLEHEPELRYLYLEPFDLPKGKEEGSVTLDIKGEANYFFYEPGEEVISSNEQQLSFLIWKDQDRGYIYLGNAAGNGVEFNGSSETALSEQSFTIDNNGAITKGQFPKIRTTKAQLEGKCVPYLELIEDGGKITGVTIRFVDPVDTSTALKKSEQNNVRAIGNVRIHSRGSKQTVFEVVNAKFNAKKNGKLETSVKFRPIERDKVGYIRVFFQFDDHKGQNSSADYTWDFRIVND